MRRLLAGGIGLLVGGATLVVYGILTPDQLACVIGLLAVASGTALLIIWRGQRP